MRSSGRRSGEEPVELVVPEARPDVSRPVEPVCLAPAEDERAELRRSGPIRACTRRSESRPAARSLSFCHSGVRRPGRYGASARFATTPSRPCALAAASSAAPSSNAGESRTAPTDGSRSSSSMRRRSSSGRVDERLARRARAGRTPSARAGPIPTGASRTAPLPASSSAQTSPSITAEGERTACDDCPCDVAEPLREVVAVATRERRLAAAVRRRSRGSRPTSARTASPAPVGQRLGERRELRAEVGGSRTRRVLAQQQPVALVPVEVRGHERPHAVRRAHRGGET